MRLGLFGLTYRIASPIAGPIGAWLYGVGGYVLVFSVALSLCTFGFILGVAKLWSFEEKIAKADKNTSLRSLLHPRHVVDSFKATLKPRPVISQEEILSFIVNIMLTEQKKTIHNTDDVHNADGYDAI